MSAFSDPNLIRDTISADFAFVPNYDFPNNTVFKSYSGDIFKMKDYTHWKTTKADGTTLLETEVSGFPLGIVQWNFAKEVQQKMMNTTGFIFDFKIITYILLYHHI